MSQINSFEESQVDDYSRRGHRPKWTIMIYIAGDNNLSANSISILQELEAAAGNRDVRVVAGYDSNAPFHKGARYLEIKHRRYMKKYPMNWGLHNDMVYPEGHLAVSPDFCNDNPSTIEPVYEPTAKEGLSRFLKWALKYHRADRHMLILFGHGVLVAGNTFLGDSTPPSFLRLNDFVRIIKTHFGEPQEAILGRPKPHLDILACDNCVMNAVESAYEIRNHVDFMIGSQDLMLAVGWPFKKLVEVVQRHPDTSTKVIARRVLKACARRLIDYTLMERSTEQSVCDLTKLRNNRLKDAIKDLADALKDGLKTDRWGRVCYPEIRDAVRLARLEAQAYWTETFVDLYDFCELLLQRTGHYVTRQYMWFLAFENRFHPQVRAGEEQAKQFASNIDIILGWFLEGTSDGTIWLRIRTACIKVLREFSLKDPNQPLKRYVVPYSYYVCPDLQYSHGLSIYFPWTLPSDPIIYEQASGSGPYTTEDYQLKTAFDEYKDYSFPSYYGTDWAGFLTQFFKATLRNVRMIDRVYKDETQQEPPFIFRTEALDERTTPPANLQKSGPDTGEQDDFPRPRIKNYPRRFYLSPEDCKHRCPPYEVPPGNEDECENLESGNEVAYESERCVPYLGWRIRGIAAQVIGLPPEHLEDSDEEIETREAATAE